MNKNKLTILNFGSLNLVRQHNSTVCASLALNVNNELNDA